MPHVVPLLSRVQHVLDHSLGDVLVHQIGEGVGFKKSGIRLPICKPNRQQADTCQIRDTFCLVSNVGVNVTEIVIANHSHSDTPGWSDGFRF